LKLTEVKVEVEGTDEDENEVSDIICCGCEFDSTVVDIVVVDGRETVEEAEVEEYEDGDGDEEDEEVEDELERVWF
jgi:hypothetical protein